MRSITSKIKGKVEYRLIHPYDLFELLDQTAVYLVAGEIKQQYSEDPDKWFDSGNAIIIGSIIYIPTTNVPAIRHRSRRDGDIISKTQTE
jgi:hypothetical protein